MRFKNILSATAVFMFVSSSFAGTINLTKDYMKAESNLEVFGNIIPQNWSTSYAGNVQPFDLSCSKSIEYAEIDGDQVLLGAFVYATNKFDGKQMTLAYGGDDFSMYTDAGIYWNYSSSVEMERTFIVDGDDISMEIYWDHESYIGNIAISLWDATTSTSVYSASSNGFAHDHMRDIALKDGHKYSLIAKDFVLASNSMDPASHFSLSFENAIFVQANVPENDIVFLTLIGFIAILLYCLMQKKIAN